MAQMDELRPGALVRGCAAPSAGAAGLLNLIHRTNSPNPATARVPGRLALAFRAPCGVWRVVDADAFFVLPGSTQVGGYSTDRKDAYATTKSRK